MIGARLSPRFKPRLGRSRRERADGSRSFVTTAGRQRNRRRSRMEWRAWPARRSSRIARVRSDSPEAPWQLGNESDPIPPQKRGNRLEAGKASGKRRRPGRRPLARRPFARRPPARRWLARRPFARRRSAARRLELQSDPRSDRGPRRRRRHSDSRQWRPARHARHALVDPLKSGAAGSRRSSGSSANGAPATNPSLARDPACHGWRARS